ncbi:outer membrane beta-barrel protein [Mongoliitalea lutea]|uniref:Outer membrane protein beta-barrel domain-containing protein n=1 Tax=Mongoliitalea lutea TaxID=849756 RepID=A0A8J3G477_9BACT|nr:outer membrane beta-barrel protein [Mongoliitalea lutea]GHB27346.1 hypothetical protein GCM10008106_05100 [Mongoliitalea lutea]
MKIAIVVLLGLISFFGLQEATAQSFGARLAPGYRVGGNVNTPSGTVMPREDFAFQTSLFYKLGNGLMLDATYLSGPTDIKFKPTKWSNWEQLAGANIRSFMAGVFYENSAGNAAIYPFGGMRIGNIAFNSFDPNFESFNRFGFSVEGGAKLPLSKNFGIFTNVNILSAVQFREGKVFENRTNEFDFTANPGLIFFQFHLGYGVYFQFY